MEKSKDSHYDNEYNFNVDNTQLSSDNNDESLKMTNNTYVQKTQSPQIP